MEVRNVGRSGLRTSLVGLGCNNFGIWIGKEAAQKVTQRALDLGITAFDTADVYGEDGASERLLGEALGSRRKDVAIFTKTGYAPEPATREVSRRHIIRACEASLTRLGTDWIDLYFVHWPDFRTPVEETLRAMDDLIHQGKVRYIGCSNYPGWQLADASWTARHLNVNPFVAAQEEYSLLARSIETERLPAIEHFGLGLTPYFPLASGMLSGKYKSRTDLPKQSRLATTPALANTYLTESNLERTRQLERFAQERGHSILELAFSWLAALRSVATIIAGATAPEQVEQNVKSVSWKLTSEDMKQIDTLLAG
ncbi:MAG: aldo/keto reductase [Steroidobacteraceae bacterium]